MIRRNAKKGVAISIIGFGKDEKSIQRLKRMANFGRGNYMHISNIEDAEEILIDEPNHRRQLSIYNMTNFSISTKNLLTEQVYMETNGKCELSLTLFLDESKSTFLDELKLYYAAYTVSSIFKGNLEEIKNQLNLR